MRNEKKEGLGGGGGCVARVLAGLPSSSIHPPLVPHVKTGCLIAAALPTIQLAPPRQVDLNHMRLQYGFLTLGGFRV